MVISFGKKDRSTSRCVAPISLYIHLFLSLQVLVVIADITKQEDIANIVNKTVEAFKQIDVLVRLFIIDNTDKIKVMLRAQISSHSSVLMLFYLRNNFH